MIVQPKSYEYIGLAGQQAAQGIRNVSNVMQQEKKVKETKFDLETLEDARREKIEEAYNEYLEASGDESPEGKRKAYNYAAQIFPPAMGKERENTELMRDRLIEADKRHYVNLANIKEKRYYNETGTEKLGVETEKLGGRVSMGDPAVSGGEKGKFTTEPTLAGMQQRELYAPPTTPDVNVPSSMGAEDRYELAKKYQILDKPGVSGDIAYASQRELAEQQLPPDATRETAAREAAKYPASTKPMEQIVSAFPTQKDVMTNERLKLAAEQRIAAQKEKLNIDRWKAVLQQRKLTNDERRQIKDSKIKAMTQRDRLLLQIKNIESSLAKANKTDKWGEPVLDQDQIESNLKGLEELRLSFDYYDENIQDYENLISEKGGIRPSTNGQTPIKNNDPLGIR